MFLITTLRILTRMIFNMKKVLVLMCTILYCAVCFSQQVKVFDVDFSQLDTRQAMAVLKSRFTGKNSLETKNMPSDYMPWWEWGEISYAGFEKCYVELFGNRHNRVRNLKIRIPGNDQEDEIMLRLSNAIREKYGVSPEITKKNNHNHYIFRIGNTKVYIYPEYSCPLGCYSIEVDYCFLQSTSVDSSDL